MRVWWCFLHAVGVPCFTSLLQSPVCAIFHCQSFVMQMVPAAMPCACFCTTVYMKCILHTLPGHSMKLPMRNAMWPRCTYYSFLSYIRAIFHKGDDTTFSHSVKPQPPFRLTLLLLMFVLLAQTKQGFRSDTPCTGFNIPDKLNCIPMRFDCTQHWPYPASAFLQCHVSSTAKSTFPNGVL